MSTLKRVTVAGFRGIRNPLTIELDGNSMLVRGDNATGKSSIVQALSLALTGHLGTATELPEEWQRHALETESKITVELADAGTIEVSGRDVTASGTGQGFLAACISAKPFLRREDIVNAIKADGCERFDYLEGFLGLESADAAAAALKPRAKQRAELVKDLERDVQSQLALLTSRLPDSPKAASLSAALKHFTSWARTLGLTPPPSIDWAALEACVASGAQRSESGETDKRRERLSVVLDAARELVPPANPAKALAALTAAEAKAQEADLQPLLLAALKAVEAKHDLRQCPVCEQDIKAAELSDRLRARVTSLKDVSTCRKTADVLAQAWTTFFERFEERERDAGFDRDLRGVRPTGRELLRSLAQDSELTLTMLRRKEALISHIDAELAKLPPVGTQSPIASLGAALSQTRKARAALERLEPELERARGVAKKLKAVEKAISDARKKVAEQMLTALGSLVSKYYEAIHPDETTGAPSIEVQRQGSGTAFLRGLFQGKPIKDPRLVYSDGHLDTVGICIFLALRRSLADAGGAADPKLLVLDDIILSIDMGHAERLLRLVRDRFGDHQVLLLSHNDLFMRYAHRILHGAKRLDIVGWSLESGPRVSPHVSHVEELREKLASCGSPRSLASSLGVVLDELLHDCCKGFAVKLPYGRADLTIGECVIPLRTKLKSLAKLGVPDVEPAFIRIGEPEFFRNAFGAHFNETLLASAVLGPIQAVARDLLEIIDQLTCTECHSTIRLKNPRDERAGLACECPRGAAPKILRQTAAECRVEQS